MSNNSTQTSEKKTFVELLKDYKVQIPIIQRDYAQGRENQKSVLNNFLNSLEEAIKNNKKLHLDFIFGKVQKSKDSEVFQPIDGQQRLTTLFLLHWYAALQSSNLKDFNERVGRFQYETRATSRKFCTSLAENCEGFPHFNNLDSSAKLSETIKNQTWFVAGWERDPSVKAMLVALDAIHEKFKGIANLEGKLSKEESPIDFLFTDLKDFALSDDLYIKMNSRGKELTAFEKFKALMEKKIADEKWDDDKEEEKDFAHLTDTEWMNFFWEKMNNGEKKPDKCQELFLRGIANLLAMSKAESEESTSEDIEDLIRKLRENPQTVTDGKFDKDDYEKLYTRLNLWCEDKQILSWEPKWKEKESEKESLWKKCIEEKPTWRSLTLLYALTLFLDKKSNNADGTTCDEDSFEDWMRVIQNIIYNTRLDGARRFISAIKLIKEISSGCDNIYQYLKKEEVKEAFSEEQVKEEIIKAKIIGEDQTKKEEIHKAEDLLFFRGKVQFAFHYCGWDNESDWEEPAAIAQDKDGWEKFKQIFEVAEKCFTKEKVKDDLFRRAFLCIDDGNYFKYNSTTAYFNFDENSGSLTKYTFISILIAPDGKQTFDSKDGLRDFSLQSIKNEKEYMKYMKLFVEKLSEKGFDFKKIIDEKEEEIGKKQTKTWKDKIILAEYDLGFSNDKRFILDEKEQNCYLLRGKRPRNSESYRVIESDSESTSDD